MGITGKDKPRYVSRMFTSIATHYDFMNRLMTFGMDVRWRRETVAMTGLPERGLLLDVATGTGDIALEVLRQFEKARVVGLDFTLAMMRLGQEKVRQGEAGRIYWAEGDTLSLPFPDGAFDAVTSGFLMRNVTDIRAAFREQARVTRPGGKVLCLEITHPENPLFRAGFRLYFYRFVPLLGRLFSSDSEAYTYLPNSLTAYPHHGELKRIMEEAGLEDVHYRLLMFGSIAIHAGTKR